MVRLITFGKFNYKYAFMIIFFILKNLYIGFVVFPKSEKISNSQLLSLLLDNIGNVLCFIPALFFDQKPTSKIELTQERCISKSEILFYALFKKPYDEHLYLIDLINIILIAILSLITEICYIILNSIDPGYTEQYIFMEILIWFLLPKFFLNLENYKHQNFAIFFITLIGIMKWIYNLYKTNKTKKVLVKNLILEAMIYLANGFYYGYLNGLMKFKYFSSFKCCYVFGFINFCFVMAIYLIVTYSPCYFEYICENEKHFDDFYSLFHDVKFNEVIILISYSILTGLDYLFIYTIIFNFTAYHALIIFHIQQFVYYIMSLKYHKINYIKFAFFFFESIFILIFLEIVELNFCGLNVNIRRNIEKRAYIDQRMISNYTNHSVVYIDEDNNYFIKIGLSE